MEGQCGGLSAFDGGAEREDLDLVAGRRGPGGGNRFPRWRAECLQCGGSGPLFEPLCWMSSGVESAEEKTE